MGPEKRAAPLGVAGIAVFVDAGLLELGRVWRAVGIMAARANELSFPQRHMGRAIELRLSLQMTLAANFYFRPVVIKRRFLTDFRELLAVRLLHQSMTSDTGETPGCVGTSLPVGLNAPLVTSEAGFILDLGRLPRIFSERNEPAYTAPTACGDVIAARTVAGFASSFFFFGPCIV